MIDLTNRDVAFLVWATIALVWAVRTVGAHQLLDLLVAVRPFLLPLVVYGAWYALVVATAWRMGIWSTDVAKDTLVWFLGPGLLLFFRFPKTYEDARFIRTTLLGFLGLTAVTEFFLNLVSFSLVVELLLIPVVTILALMVVVADLKAQTRRLKAPLGALLGLMVLGWLVATVVAFVGRSGGPDAAALARDYAVPIWSTAACLPFVYLFGLAAGYQSQFLRLGAHQRGDPSKARRAKWVLLFWFGLRSRALNSFRGAAIGDLAMADSASKGRRIIAMQQAEVRVEAATRRLTAARLARYAGDPGVDWDDQPLDQREFEGTWKVLEELALYQAAQHRMNRRYNADLLDTVGDLLRHSFGHDPEITMQVTKDGQAWHAWRRTIGGWFLGRAEAGKRAKPMRWLDRAEPAAGRGHGWTPLSEDSGSN